MKAGQAIEELLRLIISYHNVYNLDDLSQYCDAKRVEKLMSIMFNGDEEDM